MFMLTAEAILWSVQLFLNVFIAYFAETLIKNDRNTVPSYSSVVTPCDLKGRSKTKVLRLDSVIYWS